MNTIPVDCVRAVIEELRADSLTKTSMMESDPLWSWDNKSKLWNNVRYIDHAARIEVLNRLEEELFGPIPGQPRAMWTVAK